MQIVVGLVLDRFGARRFVLLGSFACAVGVLTFAATDSIWIGGAGRLLTGFGASFAFIASLWLINHWFAPERFALLSGAVNAIGMVGAAIGAIVLSEAIASVGWRTVFLVTGAVGLMLFATALAFLHEPASPAETADSGPVEYARESLRTVVGDGRIWAISVIGLLYYMPVNIYAGLWGTTELIRDHQLTPVAAQFGVSMIFWGMAIGSIVGGWLSDLLGHRKFLVFFGAILTGLAYAAVLYLPGSQLSDSILLFAAGFFGGLQMLTFAMAKEGHDSGLVGTIAAFVNMIGIAGALVFQPLVGYLADLTGGDFQLALTSVPVCSAIAALIALFVPEYRHRYHTAGARSGAEVLPEATNVQ